MTDSPTPIHTYHVMCTQAYLSLLAESTTTPGGMQKHLIKLMARGAADAHKVGGRLTGVHPLSLPPHVTSPSPCRWPSNLGVPLPPM